MLFRPDVDDVRAVGLVLARVTVGIGVTMLVPAAVALLSGERNELYAFAIGASLAVGVGSGTAMAARSHRPLGTREGLVAAALAWIVVPVFAAVPLLLSGHYLGPLDAYFEAVSGLAAVGLSVAHDVDHMARSVNLWRHLLQLLGAQAIIVVALTFVSAAGGLVTLSPGETAEVRVAPAIRRAIAAVTRLTLAYAVVSLPLLVVVLVVDGLPVATAVYHAANLFMSAFGTGAFATQSASVAFYRSVLVEAVVLVLMIAGAFSFLLHLQLQRRGRDLFRHIETRTLFWSVLALFAVLAVGLVRSDTFDDSRLLLRHGFFQLVSAHTTTGLATVRGRLVVTDWGVLAPAMLVAAMAVGGMAGSSAGGIKGARVGLLMKGLRRDVRKVLLPDNAVVVESYYTSARRVLRPGQVLGAAALFLLFLVLYLGLAMVTLFYGYELNLAFFESTSAGSTTGMSVGIVRPALETPLKVAFVAAMIIGRLEFVAAFTLVGYVVALVRGRR